jgi:AcrR family transcriptional regulator
MDKRIEKTKHMIKSAMLNLMKKKSFNKITVKEICENAFTSRITFYTYYENKNELVEDIAADIKDEIMTHYEQLQIKNNASNNIIQAHINIIDSILETEQKYFDNTGYTPHTISPEMQLYYFEYIKQFVADIETRLVRINPDYPEKLFSAFLAGGVWAYIGEAEASGRSLQDTRNEVKSLLTEILKSKLYDL